MLLYFGVWQIAHTQMLSVVTMATRSLIKLGAQGSAKAKNRAAINEDTLVSRRHSPSLGLDTRHGFFCLIST